MQDHHFPFGIAENEYIAVFEMSFLDCFFERNGSHGNGIFGADKVNLSSFSDRGISVDEHRHRSFFRQTDRRLNFLLSRMAIPLVHFFALAGGTLLGLPPRLVFDRLLFQMIKSFVYGDAHVLGLSQADQWAVARADRDFGFMAVLFNRKDHLGFESVA